MSRECYPSLSKAPWVFELCYLAAACPAVSGFIVTSFTLLLITLSSSTHLPLVVDLDGTLIKTDLLAETASRFLIEQPFRFLKLLVWLTQGKSALKSHLAESTRIDAAALPYNEELVSWLRQQKAQGRTIVLA